LGLIPPAPIGLKQQLLCLGVLLRYVFQVSKWKRIVVNTVRDVGITDGYLHSADATLPAAGPLATAKPAAGNVERHSAAKFGRGIPCES
jgi:hypothetical protein